MRTLLIISLTLVATWPAYAQDKENKILLREGNEAYQNQNYEQAIEKYAEAKNNSPYFHADYNRANTLYMQEKYEEASSEYESMVNRAQTKGQKAKAYHNLGNSYMAQKKYQDAVRAYKNALKNNPSDQETRYNLAYALEKLKEQNQDQQNKDQQNKDQQNKDQQNKDQQNKDQQNKDQQNKDQQNKDQQNKDQQNKDQQNKDQQNKDQQNKDQQNKDQQNKDQQNKDQQNNGSNKPEEGNPQKPQQGRISREQALKDLEAITNDEKKTLQKLYKKKTDEKGNPINTDKDW